jgi:DNA-binding Lrp family transcriptional regulator
MSMDIISNNVGTWLAAVTVALLTIFSDKILGRIRFSLNRADLRVKYFEQLATDLSTYVFWVVSVKSVDIQTHAFNDPGKRKEKVAPLATNLKQCARRLPNGYRKRGFNKALQRTGAMRLVL